jgi:heme oxygenase
VPPVVGAAEVLGVAYVVEGATLGGVVLLRSLEPAGLPCRFFASYGARRGAMWQAFRRHAEAFEQRGGDVARAVDAAQQTFRAFQAACRDLEAVPA